MSSERQLLEHNDPWWGEHVHRYNEAVDYIKPTDTILDLACGTGFGSDILAQQTKGKVIGGDIAAEAVMECRKNWQRDNLFFEALDGTKLAFEDEYFNVVVSFETIEHTTQYAAMLKEFARVLKRDGVAIISTPNFPVNSPSGKVTNPYHTQEFTYDELVAILKVAFGDVKIYGQKYSRYDKKTSKIGKFIEWFFSIKGIRKTPYSVKTGLTQLFIKKPFYPTPDDYTMVSDRAEILKCKTFFCICRR